MRAAARYTLLVLGLYFYRARRPTLGNDADLRDASCRPDPDFDWLTLGLCRPGLRKRIARHAVAEPVDLLFYARVPATDTLLLVALLRIASVHGDHFDAREGYPPDKQEQATQTVLEQAEVLSEIWASA